MFISRHAEDAAKECAGNHRKFDSFVWYSESKPEDEENWMIYNTSCRGSGLITESNEHIMNLALLRDEKGNAPFGDDVYSQRHSHWAYGHLNCLIIRVYKKCDKDIPLEDREITKAFETLHGLICALSDYPVLDDSDLSKREIWAQEKVIEAEAPSFGEHEEPEGWISKVYHWLWENKQECSLFDYSEEPWVSTEEIAKALDALKIKYCE